MKRLTIKQQRSVAGFLFVTPWLIGMLIFFLQAILNLLRYSFTKLTFVNGAGYELNTLADGPLQNYLYAFTKDTQFPQRLVNSLSDMLYKVPIIVVFALFIAIVLNQDFKGRNIMRAIFFIPILISSGVIASSIKESITSTVMSADGGGSIFSAALLIDMLSEMGLPSGFVETIGSLVSNVTDLIWNSSVQIIVFLMGLLTIPYTYYEVAQVEGATGWETFWKVTFPSVSPFILVNLIYSSIDHFINFDNNVMQYIMDMAFGEFNISYSAALSWSYFLIITVALAVMMFLVSLFVPFGEKKIKEKKVKVKGAKKA